MSKAREGFIDRLVRRMIHASSEALFPKNDLGAPDFEQAEMVPRTIAYLDELPPGQRRLLRAFMVAVEIAAIFFRLRPFSRLSPDARADLVRAWRASPIYPLRILGDSLKGLFTMMYMSHRDVLRYIGMYSLRARPWDALELEPRSDAFKGLDA
jgi:hypothetical protein